MLLAILAIALARGLTPDAHGFGTHVQLGLPRCGFLALTGMPCPSCGLTTAFAYMARFDVLHAVRANVVGVPLFLGTLTAIPYCMVGGVRGWPLEATLKRLRLTAVAVIIGLTVALSWIARLLASH